MFGHFDSSDFDRRMDINADGAVSPLDALMVIDHMNRNRGNADGGRADDNGNSDGNDPGENAGDENGGTDTGGDVDDGVADRRGQRDVVLDWNNVLNEVFVANEDLQNPGYASRAMAMMNLAIYDAVAIASGDADDAFYDYDRNIERARGIQADTAASEAAYTILSSLYPEQQEILDEARDEIGRRNRDRDSRQIGETIGNQILAARANDGYDNVVDYTYEGGVGSFQADPLNPDVPVWGPGWGEVDTFSITSPEDYAPATTPALTSAEYAASYNEVLELGSVDSTTRTADQTEAGVFWAYDRVGLGTPLALFNDTLEAVARQEGNSFEENAALYAQASVAMADAAIVAWHTKFSENFWRPVTAIHDGDIDGNPATNGDESWTAIGAPDGGGDIIGFTPQFPTYISGHATFGGALFGALQEFYGTDDISFTLTSEELEVLLDDADLQEEYGLKLDDAERTFDSFSEAMAENGRSRVYLGIHFDFDDLVGQEVGQTVASSVSSEFVVASGGRRGGSDGMDPNNGPGGPRGNGGGGNDGGPRDTVAPGLGGELFTGVDESDVNDAFAVSPNLAGSNFQLSDNSTGSRIDGTDEADELAIVDSIFAEIEI
ncbi:MAG: chloroperoxidase [Planctomycetota bacterium]